MNAPQYPSRAAWHAARRRQIMRMGKVPIRAEEDQAGNCRICGECGRCPGWHYHGEAGAILRVELPQQPFLLEVRHDPY